ncbi:hypothetical protein [Streptomyces sp. NPDC002994]|uniref:hypothetical protein n=1 Tax=Streptomyces sp. NPDC002994 TaxID=3154441 RepID=UPI0033A75FDA
MVPVSEQADGLPLTAEEYEAVRAALVSTGVDRWADGRHRTLNSLFAQWTALVEEVEAGYSWCAPELVNDIWCRGELAEVWPLLPPRVRSVRQPELDALDGRFRSATIAWPGRTEERGVWWKWRIPRLLEAEAGDRCERGWPLGWDMMPFPKPVAVKVSV